MIGNRVRQFLEAGRRPTEADEQLAADWLSGSLLQLFFDQHPRDAVHSAATARWLLERGHGDPDLIVAALLHDVGKGRQRRIDRSAFVIARAAGLHRRLAREDSRFELRRAVSRTLRHPTRGAAMLSAAGAGQAPVDLVRRHHADPGGNDMLSLLEEADAAS